MKKISAIIFIVYLLSGCIIQPAAVSSDNSITTNRHTDFIPASTPFPTPSEAVPQTSVVGPLAPLSTDESANIDSGNKLAAEIQQKRLKNVPHTLLKTDFGNFHYPLSYQLYGRKHLILKADKFEDPYNTKTCDNHFGGLDHIYYDYLKGGRVKQALVIVNYVSCGCGSCDGGASLIYAFDVIHNKLHLFWHFETGSQAYGDGLKSLSFRNKQLSIEQFAYCSDEDANVNSLCRSKYYAKNIIHSVFTFHNETFIEKSREIIETPVLHVWDFKTQIDVGE